MRDFAVAIAFVTLGALALGSEVCPPGRAQFTSKPKVTGSNGKRIISFAVSAATDVEVAILDAGGRVVRHLAAGRLGGAKAPPAPLKAGLKQEVVWDGKDDLGKSVSAARARVRLGLAPKFSHVFGGHPAKGLSPVGLGCGPKGELYVLSFAGYAPSTHYVLIEMKVYDRNGKYLRQVLPYSVKLPAEKLKGLKQIKLPDGRTVPMVFHPSSRGLYPEMGGSRRHTVLVRPDGKIAFTNGVFRDPPGNTGRRLLVVGPDGSAGEDFVGPKIAPPSSRGWAMAALSPDGKTIYSTGIRDYRSGKVRPYVYKTTWGSPGNPEVFATPFKDPRGIATDSKGNVYVCDRGAGEVKVYSPAGKSIASLAVPSAELVQVHAKTGAVYVMSASGKAKYWSSGRSFARKKLLKFASYKAKAPAASMALPNSPGYPRMALDSSSPQPVLWMSGIKYREGGVRRIVDKGASFQDTGCPIDKQIPKGTVNTTWLDFTASHADDRIYVARGSSVLTYDGLSGKYLGTVKLTGTKMNRGYLGYPVASWDSKSLLWAPPLETVFKFSLDGKALKWSGTGSAGVKGYPQGFFRARGLVAAPDGGFYSLHHPKHRWCSQGKVARVGPDGKAVNNDLIEAKTPVGGIRVDLQGNIYIGTAAKPKGERVPRWFKGKLPDKPRRKCVEFAYAHQYGSIIKFGPKGGKIAAEAGDLIGGSRFKPRKAEGAIWTWHGLAPNPTRGTSCSCQVARFDIDRFGRLFVPDTFRFTIQVLDSNASEVTNFGDYGNVDDALRINAMAKKNGSNGKNGHAPLPIYAGCPHSVVVTERMAYIADSVNHQIVAVKLEAAAEATCSLR